ncbi:MAG: flagellar assembly peptidoglycan hydrolase FlgJ [Chromatiaceae bacterium]|nr:flagellar assembly peptidoglycan hydrolase FlgJ [Chromatiaceae bacterium]
MSAATSLYADFTGLAELKARATSDRAGTSAEVARQFESLLIHEMTRSMRRASLGEGVLDSDQSLFYRDMLDQQMALHLSENGGIGLAAAIQRQLDGVQQPASEGREIGDYQRSRLLALSSSRDRSAAEVPVPTTTTVVDSENWSRGDFVEQLWPWAQAAAERIGIQPQALLAQAALETGWGRHIMRHQDGTPSHNLFGIKADQRWDGERVNVTTLEYEEGSAVRHRAQFRSYDSFQQSFHDYIDFLQSNPRYQQALALTTDSRAYFTALQQAGYATDPRYAEKIESVLRGPEMSTALDRLRNRESRPLSISGASTSTNPPSPDQVRG